MPRELTPAERAITNTLANGSADAAVTLRTLAVSTGWNVAAPPGSSEAVLLDHNARRSIFGRIFEVLSLTPAGRQALTEALIMPPDEVVE